jgi:hypothetical protein
MLGSALILLALAAPAPEPTATSDHWEVGRLRLDRRTALMWPHAFVPTFTLVPDRRRVHSLSLGLDLPALRGVTFDAVMVEPSDDPFLRSRTAGMPTGEGTLGYAWAGVRVQVPRSHWQMSVGRAMLVGAAAAGGILRPGSWRVSLMRRW